MLTPAKILGKRNPKMPLFGYSWQCLTSQLQYRPRFATIYMLPWQPYNLSAYFSIFLLCFWNIFTFEKYFIGSISMLKGSVYSQKSIQNSFWNFTVETIQTIALPKYGYRHYTNRLLPSWTASPWGKISIFALKIIWVAWSAFTYLHFIETYFKCFSIVIVPVLTLLVSTKSANCCIFFF